MILIHYHARVNAQKCDNVTTWGVINEYKLTCVTKQYDELGYPRLGTLAQQQFYFAIFYQLHVGDIVWKPSANIPQDSSPARVTQVSSENSKIDHKVTKFRGINKNSGRQTTQAEQK